MHGSRQGPQWRAARRGPNIAIANRSGFLSQTCRQSNRSGQEPLNGPFLHGLFSRGSSREKGNGALRSKNGPLSKGHAPLRLMGCFRAPRHGGKRHPPKRPIKLSGMGDSQRNSRDRFARIIRNRNPYFYSPSIRPIRPNHSNFRFARITQSARIVRIDLRESRH